MHHTKLIVPAALAAAVLAGCGENTAPHGKPSESLTKPNDSATMTQLPPQTSGPASGGTSDSPGSHKAPQPATPPKGKAVPKSQIHAAGLPKQFPRQAAVSGKTLTVTAMEPDACTRSTAKVLKQTGAQVKVQIVQSKPGGTMCAQIVRYPKLTVNLAEPLGDRTLVLTAKKPS